MTMTMDSGTAADSFAQFALEDVRALIEEYPLAWVVSPEKGAVSQLPLIGIFDAQDRLTSLVGHFARRNPLYRALADDPHAIILFAGPQGYISTDMAPRENWAPTWNFSQVRIEAEITLDPNRSAEALHLLLDAMESHVTPSWSTNALGERYPGMLRQIVGFSASIVTLEGRFKLSQDEDLDTLRSILAKLTDPSLLRWIKHFNRERLDTDC
jgi:transcriptional regulator